MQRFVDSWMTLIDQSERRDADCVNQLKAALTAASSSSSPSEAKEAVAVAPTSSSASSTSSTVEEALRRAIVGVRLSGVPDVHDLTIEAEVRLLAGSLGKLAGGKGNVLDKTPYVSAAGMRLW